MVYVNKKKRRNRKSFSNFESFVFVFKMLQDKDVNEWFQTKISDLSKDTTHKSALLELRSIVANLDKSVVADLGRRHSLKPIFDCLNTSNAEEIDLAINILANFLERIKPEQVDAYGTLMQKALLHPTDSVKRTILKALESNTDDETINVMSTKHAELLVEIAGCLSDPDRSVAQGAILFFTKLSYSKNGIKILYSKPMLEHFKKVMKVDDTTRFRVYEIMVASSVFSPENLVATHECGILPALLEELQTDDNLIQLNALEVITTLAACNHGLTYLQEAGVIQSLVDRILNLEKEPLAVILLPGLIEFFGHLYKFQPKQFSEQYPKVLSLLFEYLNNADPVLLGVIISTIGKIGSTDNGKQILNSHRNEMGLFLNKAGQLLLSKNDSTVTVLNSLCELLTTNANDPSSTALVNEWFDNLGPNAVETIYILAKLPFVDIRHSALLLFNVIAQQTWGAEKLCGYPGMIEYLLDRSTEFDKECKNAKYDISCSLVNCPNISSIVKPEIFIKLREFVNEGPFHVPTEPEVVIEGAS